jgi:hypothetical protein
MSVIAHVVTETYVVAVGGAVGMAGTEKMLDM